MTNPNDIPGPSDANAPHTPADDSEEIYFQGSPLLRGRFFHFLLAVIIGLALIIVPVFFKAPSLVILVCVIVGLIIMIIPWLVAKTVRYRISNYRIDYERGILSRNINTLELWHVEDLSLHQSLLDRIFGVGTITVISHDENMPTLQLCSLPHCRALFDSLKQRVIAVKRQRGVIKVDPG